MNCLAKLATANRGCRGARSRETRQIALALISLALLALSVPGHAIAAGPSVGMVTKVVNDAEVVTGGAAVSASVGTVVHMQDEISTGANARLQVTFRDQTTLSLGENARVTIDRYVFDPDAGAGEVALNAAVGALRFATGRLKNINNKQISITTPVAQLGVRGTDLWTGKVKGVHAAYVVEPIVDVRTQGGMQTLALAGQGTYINSPTAPPTPPTFWTAAEVAEALDQTSFNVTQPEQKPNRNQPERRGENRPQQTQPTQDQQYAVNGSTASLVGATIAATTFATIMSSQQNNNQTNNRTVRLISQPASP